MTRNLVADLLARLCSRAMGLLQNRREIRFRREEFRHLNFSFAQFGEDLVVLRLAEELGVDRGFYVDAGAFSPVHMSNTLLLHKRGWYGVNIDLSEGKIRAFKEQHPDDVNVCALLSDTESNHPVLEYGGVSDRIAIGASNPNATVRRATTLTALLRDHGTPPQTAIDYLNIDCEGHDLQVLQGLDLDVYPIRILSIEALDDAAEREIKAYLEPRGMRYREKVKWTLFFTSPHS